ncbi:large conductance mechanosensitive channel protein MscL [Rugosimonospora acidiphila]|uniref:Large-conductance mechanosensitive channel n=1 Tax=Rugosimonospora acidiphila TaxID=556531 RepID=A0ABP9RMB0_9ACTN
MFKGFKDFIMRGNVVDLAVGIVIGAAFTALVTQFTSSFLKPLIQLIGGSSEHRTGAQVTVRGATFAYGDFINTAITFLLTAATLYFLVVFPMNKLAERRRRGQEPPPAAPSEEVRLLTDIRDALVTAQRASGRAQAPQDPPPPPRRPY